MEDNPPARQTWADLHGGAYQEGSTPPWDIGRPQPALSALARSARLVVEDALELESRDEHYDTVLDCGLFHVFDNHDRATYVRNLGATVAPGGRCFMLCFSDQQPGDWGPRRVRRAEIESSIADGWRIESIDESGIEITIDPAGALAWLLSATRV